MKVVPDKLIPGYMLETEIGKGGMGSVYKARQTSLGREVAIKILKPELNKDPQYVARFAREAMMAAQLNHPNIVSVLETGAADGQHYIVMEYVESIPLSKMLKERKTLGEDEALKIVEGVAKALAHADKHNIIHRDIKPENIMITKDGEVKLCDLGIAKQTQGELSARLTVTNELLGTPYYVSPEALTGNKLDIRCDVYSLGIVLYEMTTGRLPFISDAIAAAATRRLTENPEPPRKLNNKISPNMNNLILRMMARKPEHRLTPEQLIEVIQQGKRVSAPPKPSTKWIMLGTAALLVIVVLFVLFTGGGAKRERALFSEVSAKAEKLLAQKRFSEAKSAVESFAATDPEIKVSQSQLFKKIDDAVNNEFDSLGEETNELIKKGDKDAVNKMLLKCEREVGAYPGEPFVYLARGAVRNKLGNRKEALEDFNKALDLNPKDSLSYYNRGLTKTDLGDDKGAIEDFDKAIALSPRCTKAYIARGLAKYNLKDNTLAIEDFDKAIALSPRSALAYNNRGNAKVTLGDKKGAIEDYNRTIEINPTFVMTYYNRGLTKYTLGDYKGAMEDCEKSLLLDPNLKDKLQPYIDEAKKELAAKPGETKLGQGDWEGAIADCNRALAANPNDADAYENRGSAEVMMGKRAEALADFDKALELKPDFAEAYDNRGVLKYMMGDCKGALLDMEKAVSLHPAYKTELQPTIDAAKKKLKSEAQSAK